MFLKPIPKNYTNKLKYAIFILSFFIFMGINMLAGRDISTQDMLQQSVENIGKLLTFASLLIPFVFLAVFLLIWVKVVHNQSITSLITSRRRIDLKRMTYAFSVWTFFSICSLAISYLLSPNDYVLQFDALQFLGLLIISITLIPIQTTFEELFFRGYLMQGIYMFCAIRIVPFLLSSILFGLMHISNPEVENMGIQIMIIYIGSGLFLGALTLLDDGMELAIGYHAANNLVGCLLLTSEETVFQTPSIFRYVGNMNMLEIYIQVFVIFPILLFIFKKRFGFSISLKKLL